MENSLEIFWYIVIIASICCYAMLDGFDLGVGVLHLFAKTDHERRIFLNAIGPVWDGNEVWLVVLIGALFAGFPFAYATLFSAFYIPLTCLICGLIFRAVAIEFRSRMASMVWRTTWDILFFGASLVIALGVGIALGNLIYGIPLDENHEFVGRKILSFWHPYPLLIGVLTLSVFVMHGTIFLIMKTEGEIQTRIKSWVNPTTIFFIIAYVVTTMVTLIYQEHMVERMRERPYLFLLVLADILAIANILHQIHQNRPGWAFISSCFNIGLLLVLFAVGSFPDLIRSSINPENSLTLFNSAASPKTMRVLAIIVMIGIPLVIAYGYYIYRVFRGKVTIDEYHSY
jgi:cytochrome bd ubiquinol oxidase subunit II